MSSIKLKGSSSGEAIITTASDGSSVILDKKLDLDGQELILDSDADTSITVDSDDVIDVKVGGNDNVEINALGSSRKLKVYKGGNDELVLQSNAPDASGNMRKIELEGENVIFSTGASGGTSTTQNMIINSNGRVDMGDGSYTNGAKLTLSYTSTTEQGIRCADTVTSGTHTQIQFLRGGTQVGKIECANQASTAYVTSSDYRMKENVNYSWDATTKLKQLKPAEFTWKAEYDSNKTKVQGFLAHEVSDIVPEAVSGEKDAEEMQGIDQSKLVPLLVKTIQEQQTVIEDLQSRVTTLEG